MAGGGGGGLQLLPGTGAVGIGSGTQMNVMMVLNPPPPPDSLLSSHTTLAVSSPQAPLLRISNAQPSAVANGATLPVLCWNRLPQPYPDPDVRSRNAVRPAPVPLLFSTT